MSFFRTLFFRKKKAPLVCTLDLHDDPTHVHTDACFVEIKPLSVAEVFVSQSCEACPPAIPVITKAASANPNVLQLTYNVTYWNARSGWDDTLSSATWDARQRAYVTRWKRTGLFTPQVIIDGVADGACAREGEFNEVLSQAIEARNASPLAVGMERANERQVKIASETSEAEVHDVVVISYSGKGETVKVGKGPNKGKKIVHANVVRSVAKVDEWRGGPMVVELPDLAAAGADLAHVMVLQHGVGGSVVAACKL